MNYCVDPLQYRRRKTREVKVGGVVLDHHREQLIDGMNRGFHG